MMCDECSNQINGSIYGGSCIECHTGIQLNLMAAASDLLVKRGWLKHFNGWVVAPSYSSWIKRVQEYPMPFMVDNGAWSDYLNGVTVKPQLLLDRTLQLCEKVVKYNGHVKFMVLPDKVQDWQATYQNVMCLESQINDIHFPKALAIQDGFKIKDIENILEKIKIDWFFIGGSDFQFKKYAVNLLSVYGIKMHVGKVHRVEEMCYFSNIEIVKSIDTSTYSRPQSKARIERLGIRLDIFSAYKKGKQMKII